MGGKTGIQWTDATWNPLRGCSRVSEGCRNCYAEKVAARFSGPGAPYEGLAEVGAKGARWNGQIKLVHEHLGDPLRWRKPRRIFVNSMSDLFHEAVPFEYIAAVFGVMAAAREHTFQILTKRPKRALAFFEWLDHPVFDGRAPFDVCARYAIRRLDPKIIGRSRLMDPTAPWPPPNVWLGVSVEDQATADTRIPILLDLPAAMRFISAEPLLGPICFGGRDGWLSGTRSSSAGPGIDWVIVGGESGPGARVCDVAWVRMIVAQCQEARTACFVKQLGAKPVAVPRCAEGRLGAGDLYVPVDLIDRKGGDPEEWPKNLRVRQMPRGDER